MSRSMTPQELIDRLYELAEQVEIGGSATTRSLALAMDPYRGRSELLDKQMAVFDEARQAFEKRVWRGYQGRTEWNQMTACAPAVARAMRVLTMPQEPAVAR